MADTDVVVPPVGESITEAVVARWLKAVGDAVAVDETIAELETDKITVQVPSPVAGVLKARGADEGATVKVGEVIARVEGGAKAAAKPAAAAPPPASVATSTVAAKSTSPSPSTSMSTLTTTSTFTPSKGNGEMDRDALLKLTPSQRMHAREVGSLPTEVRGPRSEVQKPTGPDDAARLAQVDPRDEVVAMSPLRKRVAERLVQAQHEAASLTTFNEVDMSAVMDMRAKYKDSFEKAHGVKLGFMSFFVKACVAACKQYPGVNAELIGGSIVYKRHYDFGIAVSTPKGLVVPVLRDCDARGFAEVERGIGELAVRARDGKLALADLQGGTFSITNGGIYGSMMSTPLLNYPQTGILGMHNIVKRAIVIGDDVKVRPMMYVALSYDHRVVDGREAVSFLVAVKERLEAPDRMLVEV
jgi:2-oxoglutarate dehydrogenase E2 component (dihydrolipoamide succinyltransferase)